MRRRFLNLSMYFLLFRYHHLLEMAVPLKFPSLKNVMGQVNWPIFSSGEDLNFRKCILAILWKWAGPFV